MGCFCQRPARHLRDSWPCMVAGSTTIAPLPFSWDLDGPVCVLQECTEIGPEEPEDATCGSRGRLFLLIYCIFWKLRELYTEPDQT